MNAHSSCEGIASGPPDNPCAFSMRPLRRAASWAGLRGLWHRRDSAWLTSTSHSLPSPVRSQVTLVRVRERLRLMAIRQASTGASCPPLEQSSNTQRGRPYYGHGSHRWPWSITGAGQAPYCPRRPSVTTTAFSSSQATPRSSDQPLSTSTGRVPRLQVPPSYHIISRQSPRSADWDLYEMTCRVARDHNLITSPQEPRSNAARR